MPWCVARTANGHAFGGARGSKGDEVSEWRVHPSGETAVGAPVPVIADGALFAQVTVWSDDDGVRVCVDWQTDDALSGPRAVASRTLCGRSRTRRPRSSRRPGNARRPRSPIKVGRALCLPAGAALGRERAFSALVGSMR